MKLIFYVTAGFALISLFSSKSSVSAAGISSMIYRLESQDDDGFKIIDDEDSEKSVAEDQPSATDAKTNLTSTSVDDFLPINLDMAALPTEMPAVNNGSSTKPTWIMKIPKRGSKEPAPSNNKK